MLSNRTDLYVKALGIVFLIMKTAGGFFLLSYIIDCFYMLYQEHMRRIHQIMKKALSLFLCLLTIGGALAGCSTLEPDDKGAIIDMYLTTEVYNFDPALGYNDDAMTKIFGLIYEGLTTIDENGKWKLALAKDYEVIENEKTGEYKMQITLKNTKWSDGRAVQADDIVYAWKRILEPEFQSEACALLYDIKNARDVKNGDATIDDLGVAAVDTRVLEIQFEGKIDYDQFMENLASPALVPLREDIVTKNENWAKKPSTMATNGPFVLKSVEYGNTLALERSNYYYLDSEKEEALDKYVIPYRLQIILNDGAEARLTAFENGEIFYDGELPLSKRAEYKDKAVVTDMPNTHTYMFNTKNELFADANVRKALSLAIDRNEIVNIVTFAKPATGLVSHKVFDGDNKSTFREVGGDLISPTANISEAQNLLKTAGVSGGSFSIKIRPNEVDRAIADYVAGQWNSLGFNVTVEEMTPTSDPNDSTVYTDTFTEAYRSGDFDVIAVDLQMLSADAFSTLAPFAKEFSGNGVDMENENYEIFPHITGYDSEAYNALIQSAYDEKNIAARTQILHDAEKQLIEDMPVIPIIFLQDAYVASDELSGIGTNFYGVRDFKKTKLKDYMKYKLLTDTASDAEAGSETTAG